MLYDVIISREKIKRRYIFLLIERNIIIKNTINRLIHTIRVFSKIIAGIFTKIVTKKNIRIYFGKLFL